MSAATLNSTSSLNCTHGGTATPVATASRVSIAGQPAVIQMTSTYSISACPYYDGSTYMPCLTAQWSSAATRVLAQNEPLLLQNSQATTSPNGVSLTVVSVQSRVTAT